MPLPKPPRRRELHVLFVSPPGGEQDALADSLRQPGYEVCHSYDPGTAAEAAKVSQPDVVILTTADFETARAIHRAAGWRKPLIVALTSHADDEAYRQSRDAGVHLYAEQPVDPQKIGGLLRRFRSLIADVEGFDPVI